MRCICCDAMLPTVTVYRTILVPHPELPNKTTTKRIEEDMCSKCAVKSRPNYIQEDTEDLRDLGLELPEIINYDY